jgi:hypothetical protein
MEAFMDEPICCRSEEGITVGLVDSLIAIARVLAKRDLRPAAVCEALKDLQNDEDIRKLMTERT